MVRPHAPRTAGDSNPGKRDSPATPQDLPVKTPPKGWPFAEGSQNHQDDTAAPWPRPTSRPAK